MPLGLEGRDLSAVTYELVGEDTAESMSEVPTPLPFMLRADDLLFLPKIPPSRGIRLVGYGEKMWAPEKESGRLGQWWARWEEERER